MSPAGMWTHLPALAVESDSQTFRCKPVDVLALDLARAGGMNVACQQRCWWSFVFAGAAEPLGRLEARVAAGGGKLSRTNEGERWAGEKKICSSRGIISEGCQ